MRLSGIDHFARLVRSVAESGMQPESQVLVELAQGLVRLPPEDKQRVAYNSVMDHAVALNLGLSLKDVEEDHFEEYRLGPERDDPKLFLDNLILDIDGLTEDAELRVSEEDREHLVEEADHAVIRDANVVAREIASTKAQEAAREAAEEAYRLAYQWAYEDTFQEAYQQALLQATEVSPTFDSP